MASMPMADICPQFPNDLSFSPTFCRFAARRYRIRCARQEKIGAIVTSQDSTK
jgi:hypothetical protein